MSVAPAPPSSRRFAHAGVLALTVLVFAAVVLAISLGLRAGLREQILTEQAEKIAAVASMQLDNSAGDLGDLPLSEAPGVLLFAVLKTSKLPGVAGVRVFDAQRRFNSAWPIDWTTDTPSDAQWTQLMEGRLIGRADANISAEELIGLGSQRLGIVEVWVPLRPSGTTLPIGAA